MKELAKMLGLELYEEFTLDNVDLVYRFKRRSRKKCRKDKKMY